MSRACLAAALLLPLGCVAIVVESTDAGDEDASASSTGDGDPSTGTSSTGDPSTGDGDGDPGPPASFRVVVLADPHVPGPDYAGGEPGIDMTRERLIAARDKITAIDPPPDFVVVLGDLVHAAYPSSDPSWYSTNPSAFTEVVEILDGFPMPVYPVFGDSDYGVPEQTKQLSHLLFGQFFATDPYYSVDHLGWRFIFTNSQIGQTVDQGTVLFDTTRGSYGDAQLNWIRSQLDADLPTVLFSHFPLHQVALGENADGTHADIEAAIAGADRLALILAGHVHTWTEMPASFEAPHISFAATGSDSDNFLLFEFTSEALQYQILDKNKVEWGGWSAETWIYEGEPMPGG